MSGSGAGIFIASGVFWLLKTALGLQPTTIFLLGSIATLVGTIYAVRLVPVDGGAAMARWEQAAAPRSDEAGW